MSDRAYPNRPILAVSTAVIREGRVLLAARANAPGAGLYSLPGGVVEIGETLAEAAARELMEEVEVTAAPVGLCGARDIIVRDAEGLVSRHFVVVTFAARWIAGEGVLSPEASDIRWVSASEARDLPTTEGLHDALAAAFALADPR
ncbi:NUDIX domain-containing protein [Phreatobacter aquaticus]|uniref:NUDIX domain-containing protein n=1 Tax=Phreatobacter aquaticus TaxID=2570229 RepID=A0A4D7QE43_9HYPH|nr:NUDIX hydrolase [Phreatobacter aquaticus]QCK86270.1 NUDIX domain-containing protein [Phreatobacter aquaticus]